MEKQYYKRRTTVAFLIFILALVFLSGYIMLSFQSKVIQSQDKTIILSESFGSISELICSNSENFVFKYTDEKWECTSSNIPIDNNKIEDLCNLLFKIESVRVLEDAMDYYHIFGFDIPTCTLTIKSERNVVKLIIGAHNTATDTYYLINESHPEKVYLIREKYVTPYLLSEADIVPGIERDLPQPNEIIKLELISPQSDYFLKRTETLNESLYSSSYKWAVEDVNSTHYPGYDNRLSAFVDSICSLGKCERISFCENGNIMSSFDLSENSKIILTYSCENGLNTTQLIFSEPSDDGCIYFTNSNKNLLYKMDAKESAAFLKHFKPTYVMAKNLCKFSLEELEKVCVHGKSLSLELNIINDDKTEYCLVNGCTVDPKKAEALINKIQLLPCEGYLPQESIKVPEHIADTLEIAFKTSTGDVKLTLDMYDYNFYIAKIDNVNNALISKTNVTELKQLATSLCD